MSSHDAIASETLSAAFRSACLAELEALKPGNVHIFADGHGMAVQDFVLSAEAAAAVIAREGLSVGERINSAVAATWQAVNCNTNLGIVLLSAPLIHAALNRSGHDLRECLKHTLRALTVEDARLAYAAIVLAAPAGLGDSEQHDVHDSPAVTLLDAMHVAAHRDMIARQIDNGYQEIFKTGLPEYRAALLRWHRPAWALTAVYLKYLSGFPDTHIERKFGASVALATQREAGLHYQRLMATDNPKLYQRELLMFDADLKQRGLNPGTSADLTVATLLADTLESLLANAS